MILERLKQNSSIKRKFGVHGRIKLKLKDGSEKMIYTLESPWDFNEDEKNGIVGLSCVNEGSYDIIIEESPVMGIKVPFIVNPSLNVQLRQKDNAIDRTGHALVPKNDIDVFHIYGRYIIIGSDILRHNEGFYEPTDGTIALSYLMEHIKESGDNKLVIKWL